MSTSVTKPKRSRSLIEKFGARYSIEPDKLLPILKATAFKQSGQGSEVTNEQMAALLVVADQYGLNPFTRELFAFPDKHGGIIPVVSIDGWMRIMNANRQSDGLEFRHSEEWEELPKARPCPIWMEAVIHRKDKLHPIVVREYLDEVYRPALVRNDGTMAIGPWQTHTKRMLRHKTLIQGGRIAYGFSGIYEEDEAQRFMEIDVTPEPKIRSASAALKKLVVDEPQDVVPEPAPAAPEASWTPTPDEQAEIVKRELAEAAK